MKKRSRLRGIATLLIILFVLWQVWQKVHFVIWVPMPWWGLLLFVVGVIVVLDLALESLIGDD